MDDNAALDFEHAIDRAILSRRDLSEILQIVLTALTAAYGYRFDRAAILAFEGDRLRGALGSCFYADESGEILPVDLAREVREEAERFERAGSFESYVWRHVGLFTDGASRANARWRSFTLPVDETIAAAQEGPLTVGEPAAGALADLAAFTGASSFVLLPIHTSRGPYALLYADNAYTGRPIGEQEATLGRNLADRAAVAIENALLYHETQEQLTGLQSLVNIASDMNRQSTLSELLSTVITEALSLTGLSRAALLLVRGERLRVGVSRGIDDDSVKAFNAIEPLITGLEDAELLGGLVDSEHPHRLVLRTGDGIVGVIVLEASAPDRHGLLRAFADLAAVAVHKARLAEEQARTIRSLTFLHRTSSLLATGSVLATLRNDVATFLQATFPSYAVRIGVYEGDRINVTTKLGARPAWEETLPLDPITEWVRKSGRTATIADTRLTRTQAETVPGARAVLVLPMRTSSGPLGVVRFEGFRARPFNERMVRLLSIMVGNLSVALENARTHLDMQNGYSQTVEALARAIEAKDTYTRGHIGRVVQCALKIGETLNLSPEEMQDLRFAAALHDIGKIGVPREILNKPGPLTAGERALAREHPLIGERIIKDIPILAQARLAVRHHHEQYDGAGYPDGLAGEQIPLLARIIGVADAYDSMAFARPYRRPMTRENIIAQFYRSRGTQYDPKIVDALFRVLPQLPAQMNVDAVPATESIT